MKYQILFTEHQHAVLVALLTEMHKQIATTLTQNDRPLSDPLWEGLSDTNELLEVLQ